MTALVPLDSLLWFIAKSEEMQDHFMQINKCCYVMSCEFVLNDFIYHGFLLCKNFLLEQAKIIYIYVPLLHL